MHRCKDCLAETIVRKIEDDIIDKYPSTIGQELNQRSPQVLRNMRLRWKALILSEINKAGLV